MYARMRTYLALTSTLGLLLGLTTVALGPADPVQAAVEGPQVTFSPHAGGAIWASDVALNTDMIMGGRIALMPTPRFGFEGSLDVNPTAYKTDSPISPGVFNRITRLSGNLILNLAPFSSVNPYITGGWANVHVDPGDTFERNFNAWEFGGGFKFRLLRAEGREIALRLDARDLMVKFDPPFTGTEMQQHNIFVALGVDFTLGASDRDSDGDGISDRSDDCPGTPAGVLVSRRGCPLDGDGDGVADGLDVCPETALGAVVDARGCPTDGDGDGVPDGIDRCANTPRMASVDALGCPIDTDRDGVPDGVDQCPGTPAGVAVDNQGCVADSDGDGVNDIADKCPNTQAGHPVDTDGCPIVLNEKETELLDTGLIRLDSVYFQSGRAVLQPRSFPSLDEMANILAKWPQLKIEISGHTDSQGDDALNQRLSEQRAQAVLDYLAARYPDLALGQLSVRGYGESQSIATNDTADGRARNRRVEFRVLNREVLRQ